MNNDLGMSPLEHDENAGASKKLITSAVVVAAIVVLGLVLSLTNLLGGDADPAPNPTAPAPSASGGATADPSAAGSGEDSVCGLDAVELTGTLNTPPPATWTLLGTTAAPAIEGQGPGKVEDDGFRSCYARTPTGAVLAAANYGAIGSYTPLRKTYYERATVPGLGRDALLKKPIPGDGSAGNRVQIAGFRVLRYDGRTADIDLALRTSNGALGAFVFNLEWSGGDWKLRLADDGSELSPVVQLPSLSGYVLWAGA
ncbi:MAG: hypothetical protein ACRCYX_12190 [Dermatophilaceae bacterium]